MTPPQKTQHKTTSFSSGIKDLFKSYYHYIQEQINAVKLLYVSEVV